MSLTIKVGITSKARNSTRQTFDYGTEVTLSCTLKNFTSEHEPTFIVKGLTHGVNYNFVQWENNYYWITNIVYQTYDLIEISCTLDVLATFKDYIKNTNYYLLYADRTHWNEYVDDMRFQPEKTAQNVAIQQFNIFHTSDPTGHSMSISSTGTVFVRVMETGETSPSGSLSTLYPPNYSYLEHQGVNTYAFTPTNFKKCLMDLTDACTAIVNPATGTPSLTDVEFIQSVCKLWSAMGGAGSWRQNILSVIFVPIDYGSITYSGQSGVSSPMSVNFDGLFFGCVPSIVPCKKMINPITIWNGHQTVSIPWSSATATPGNSDTPASNPTTGLSFLRNERWCAMQIYTPVGYQALKVSSIKDQNNLGVWSSLNVCTGEWSMRITEKIGTATDGGENLASFSGSIGVDLTSFVGNGSSLGAQANNFATKVVGAVLGGGIGGGFGSSVGVDIATQLLPSGIDSNACSGSITGNTTSMFLTNSVGNAYIVGQQYVPKITQTDYINYCNKYGYPCNNWINPNTDNVSGYIQASNAMLVDCPGAMLADKSEIDRSINSGILIQ